MQLQNIEFGTRKPTLKKSISELGDECQNLITLVHQFQLSDLSPEQKAKILSELLSASIHLHRHCDDEFQSAIADELETLPKAQ